MDAHQYVVPPPKGDFNCIACTKTGKRCLSFIGKSSKLYAERLRFLLRISDSDRRENIWNIIWLRTCDNTHRTKLRSRESDLKDVLVDKYEAAATTYEADDDDDRIDHNDLFNPLYTAYKIRYNGDHIELGKCTATLIGVHLRLLVAIGKRLHQNWLRGEIDREENDGVEALLSGARSHLPGCRAGTMA